jgi:hypothetical protein
MPTATLKPVKRAAKGHNRFCGPAALSIITGIDTAEASAVIRFVNKKRSVTGTHDWEIIKSLNLLGYHVSSAAKLNPLTPKTNPTLAAWLKSDERDGKTLYLVVAGNHWQVVQGRRYCCGLSSNIVSIRDAKVKRRARVTAVYRIDHARKVALAEVLPAKVKVKDTEATIRRKAKRLADEYGIDIETYRSYDFGEYNSSIIVWGQRDICDDEERDPFFGDHYADDWADALERVQEYVKLAKLEAEAA